MKLGFVSDSLGSKSVALLKNVMPAAAADFKPQSI